MAVVKKYQPGGSLEKDSFKDFLAKKLKETKFTTKGEKLAKDAASKWEKLYSAGNFDEVYSYDPIQQEYTINTDKITDDSLKNQIWSGSKDVINKNIFGQYSAKGDKSNKGEYDSEQMKFNTLLSAWINEYKEKNKSSESLNKPLGIDKSITDLFEYMAKEKYGGGENAYDLMQTDFSSIKTDDERKARVTSLAKDYLAGYLSDYEQNKNIDRYSKIKEVQDVMNSLNTGDWESFRKSAYNLGWDVNKFLLNDDEKKELENQQVVANQKAALDLYQRLGINDDNLINSLYQQGFTQVDENFQPKGWEGQTWFKDFLKSQNAIVLKNDKGYHRIIRNGHIYDAKIDNPFATGYGYAWKNEETGTKFYNPKSSNISEVFGQDPYEQQNIGKQLDVTVPGYEGWSVYGFSKEVPSSTPGYNQHAKDILGRRSFTEEIVLMNNDGQKVRFFRQNDGSYKSQDGLKTINLPQIKGFGQGVIDVKTLDERYPDIPMAPDKLINWYRKSDVEYALDLVNKDIKNGYDLEMKNLSYLKRALTQPEIKNDSKLQSEIRAILDAYENSIEKKRIGGILKYQYGQKLIRRVTPKESMQTLNNKIKVSKGTTIHQLFSGNATSDDLLTGVSLAGDIMSFVPGIGIIGGLVSTGADLIKDMADNGQIDDWGTHGLNIGFAALSAIGLGGVKSVVKLAKAAGKANKAMDVSSSIAKLGNAAKDLKYADELLKIEQTLGKKATVKEIGEAVTRSGNKELEKEFIALVASTTKSDKAVSYISKYGKKALENKGIKTATQIGLAIPAGTAAISGGTEIVKTIVDPDKKIGNIDVEDLRRVVQAASIGKQWMYNKQSLKALKRQTFEGGSKASTTIKSGDKTYDLEGEYLEGVAKKEWTLRGKRATDKTKAAAKEEYHKKLTEEIKKKYNIDIKNIDDVSVTPAKKEGLYLKEKPSIEEGQGFIKARKEWERAKKLLGENVVIEKPKIEPKIEPKVKTIKPKSKRKIWNYGENMVKPELKSKRKYVKKQKDSMNSAMLKQGGILKLQKGKPLILDSLDLKLVKPVKPIEQISNTSIKYKPTDFSKILNPTKEVIIDREQSFKPKTRRSSSQILDVKQDNSKLGKVLKSFDSNTLANLAMYFNTLRGNAKSTSQQQKAVMEGVVNLPMMSKSYVRITDPYKGMAENEISKMNTQASNIASSVSDIDKALGIRFAGASKGADIKLNYSKAGQEHLEGLKQKQDELNRSTDQYNLGVIGQNRASLSDASSKLHLLDANLTAAKTTALNQLITNFERNKQLKQRDLDRNKLFDLSQDSEMKSAYENYQKISSQDTLDKYKKEYDEEMKQPYATYVDFEESKQYKNWLDQVKIAKESVELYVKKMETAQLAYSYGVPNSQWRLAKGGTINDKIILEEVKQDNRKELQREKQFYLLILKNNELMQKALIKVFK